MPERTSPSPSPVGIIISPGRLQTTGTRLSAYLWSTESAPEREARRQRRLHGPDPTGGTTDLPSA